MRSVAADFDERRLVLREIAEPAAPGPGEVLLRIHEVGVCGTDREIAAFRVGEPPAGERSLVIGHEALGEVVQCGAGVMDLEPGDPVVPMVRRPCSPPCASCAAGRRDLCLSLRFSERGIFRQHGYFAEYAVDRATDLVRVPPAAVSHGVLVEPLSVVEKAIARAIALRQSDGRKALVLGLGAIGILAASALAVRGFRVTVCSREPADHPRVRLLSAQSIRYMNSFDEASPDVILEATGAGDLALAALRRLAPCGSFIVIGAMEATGTIRFGDVLLKNQAIAGIVNASPADYEAAVEDLARIPEEVRAGMVARHRMEDFERTIAGPPDTAPKSVHVIDG